MSDSPRSETNLLNRRAVVKAAAWAAPTIALAVASPAHAASPGQQPAGLQGWIAFAHPDADTTSSYTVHGYDTGAHAYGTYGLWVTNTKATSTITGIRIYLHYQPGPAAWSPRAESSSWSDLKPDGTTTIDGVVHQTYRMDYVGSVTPANGVTKIRNDMFFESDEMSFDKRPSFYIDRYVIVDGVELAFRRGRDQSDYTPLNDNTPPNLPSTEPSGRLSRMTGDTSAGIDSSLAPA
ncbi:hypothetical protein [Pseudoclavibacter sp. RFBA6]|uniref:hypothetical protein n=1 Tax=Pseudoclavibacter sp. RFBA6 TaxID=2080573 RepID=UPI000CE8E40A|nr:hypothetical protein [Pseudoclavibacter sp. RFBA6]PPG38019.1 hypothetical protein C5C17_15290 [Pseudoclavibacter sp. RFBA6]